MKNVFILLFLIIPILLSAGLAPKIDPDHYHFPYPKELESQVNFWLKVYTEVPKNIGLLHDEKDLSKIYKEIDITGLKGRRRKRFIRREKRKLARELRISRHSIRFQKGQKDNFREGIKRSFLYLPYIKRVFSERELPEDLAYLPHVESSFNYKAYSKMGAAGIWQFMRGTGRRFMKISYAIDERRDPIEATVAAAKLLQKNYATLGAWPLALTAYNHGRYGMKRAVKKVGSTNIVDIINKYRSRSFGFASRNFYCEFLAARFIAKNYKKFFPEIEPTHEVEFETYKLPFYTDIKDLYRNLKMGKEVFQEFNPALRYAVIRGERYIPKNYRLKVPKGKLGELITAVEKIPDSKKYIKQRQPSYYRVRYGDNLSIIARRFRVKISEIAYLNNIRRGRIYAGQVIQIPKKGQVVKLAKARKAEKKNKKTLIAKVIKTVKKEIKENKAEKEEAKQEELAVNEDVKKDETPLYDVKNLYGPPPSKAMLLKDKLLNEIETRLLVSQYKDIKGHRYGYILVQPEETMSHLSDWLIIPKRIIKSWNKRLRRRRSRIYINQRIKLYFGKVSKEEFESKRIDYHKQLFEDFFESYEITGTETHTLKRGESLWHLSNVVYNIPLWVIYMYNMDNIDYQKFVPGMKINIPTVVSKNTGDDEDDDNENN
jgi:membrane-bound lytic murein transglycosylase D